MRPELLRVGKIVRGFGIKGEVKVSILTDFPQKRFKTGNILIFKLDTVQKELVLKSVRYHQNHVLLSFEGYDDLSAVEALGLGELFIRTDDLPKDGTIYAYQYYDCQVYDQNGQLRGMVVDVLTQGPQLLLRVKTESRETLIPVVDAFIIKRDFETSTLVVNWMEGL